jgi:hypothetical protein
MTPTGRSSDTPTTVNRSHSDTSRVRLWHRWELLLSQCHTVGSINHETVTASWSKLNRALSNLGR